MAKKAAKAKPSTKAKGAKPAKKSVRTTSTFSPRLEAIHGALDREIRRRFPNAQARFEYNMHGWKIPRPVKIESWKGTMDPNFLHLYIAERKNGITFHIWDTYNPYGLKQRSKELTAAGFKVMVACLVYNRKGDYPMSALTPILDTMREEMDAES